MSQSDRTRGFRESMNWLHTWAGVVLGALLFAIFWMGTLSVFDREIDRWMMPDTRLALPAAPASFDAVAARAGEIVPAGADWWFLLSPSEREPLFRLGYLDAEGAFLTRQLDPASGAVLPDPGTLAGTGFIFPFHYSLHLSWNQLGYWLVGLAGMAMLVLLVSGVVIHRKIFADFFTFRPDKKLPRSSLDLHNLTGVLGLPFHFAITLSGLIIFFTIYFPTVMDTVYDDDRETFFAESFGGYQRTAAGRPAGGSASLDAMAAQASALWEGGVPSFLRVWHPGDAAAYVEVRRSFARQVTMNVDTLYFDAADGAVLHSHTAKPVMTLQRFLSGLHFIQFEHWVLRWLYFLLGLSGCVMIATGYLFWLESRRKRHAGQGLAGVRVVEGLTVGAVTGILIATLAFFVANRLLPPGASFAGYERAGLEIWAFYLIWLATFAHAWMRPGRAWREQCWAVAGLALLAVTLNAATTGDHLLRTLAVPHLWPVAGMDLLLLVSAAIAALTAQRLGRRARPLLPQTAGAAARPAE
ncbi:PepSY-associated TM helix domain-containing protein [Algihabitans sp.]|uniref:PepSY-associated TM helix domain-containing protein n=1 Tax=Algihabitans sp. TaxID=2821514 RepID=UPI003BA842F9